MITSSASRSRRVSFNQAFAPMYDRCKRVQDRSADIACKIGQKISWLISNNTVGLGTIIALTVAVGCILAYTVFGRR